jgi:hypothetical protein
MHEVGQRQVMTAGLDTTPDIARSGPDRRLRAFPHVVNVPADEFERQVESDSPPTITDLAEQGASAPSEVAGDAPAR